MHDIHTNSDVPEGGPDIVELRLLSLPFRQYFFAKVYLLLSDSSPHFHISKFPIPEQVDDGY